MNFKIRQYENFEFNYISIDESPIKYFGITNIPIYRRDGYIKKFIKQGYIRTVVGKYYNKIMVDDIKAIKDSLKQKIIKISKENVTYPKPTKYGMSYKSAVNWNYEVINLIPKTKFKTRESSYD